jgi:hypothetical protein
LEKGFERQMRQLQFGGLGQCRHQHPSRPHNYPSPHERTSTSSAQWEKEDRNVCDVRSRELVSQSCFLILTSSADDKFPNSVFVLLR